MNKYWFRSHWMNVGLDCIHVEELSSHLFPHLCVCLGVEMWPCPLLSLAPVPVKPPFHPGKAKFIFGKPLGWGREKKERKRVCVSTSLDVRMF